MLLRSVLVALSLAHGIAATPIGKEVLGYRTVSKLEADAINAKGAPVYDDSNVATGSGGKQIGPGIYTSPTPGDYPPKPGDWTCVIYADTVTLEFIVAKLWVPEKVDSTILWFRTGTQIDDYINNQPDNWTPGKTLLMSWLQYKYPTNKYQLLIPPPLVDDAGLALEAVCKETIDELPDKDPINYDNWEFNIRGDHGPQVTLQQMRDDPDYDEPTRP